MRAFLRWCYLENLIDIPIHEKFKPMKTAEDTIEALTVAEIKTLLNAFDESTFAGFRDKVMVMVLLDSMVRISELLAMKRDNVDFKTGIIKIVRIYSETCQLRRFYVRINVWLYKEKWQVYRRRISPVLP
jgi:integrase/recombinase XerD